MLLIQRRWIIFTALLLWGCATHTVKAPEEGDSAGPEGKPKVDFLPHTNGVDLAELRAIFKQPGAPVPEALEKCDFDYQIEKKLSASKDQLFITFPRYISSDPVKYHWCFYFKLLQLRDQSVTGERALGQAEFLADVARIMQVDLHEPRYLQLARRAYQELSTWEYFTSVKPASSDPAMEE